MTDRVYVGIGRTLSGEPAPKEETELTERIAPFLFEAWTEVRKSEGAPTDLVALVKTDETGTEVRIGPRQELIDHARQENQMAMLGPIAHASAYDATPLAHQPKDAADMIWVLVWTKEEGAGPRVACTIRWGFELPAGTVGSA